MTIEIIGAFSHRNSAEHRPAPLSGFDLGFIRDLVQAYDRNGYDRMLIANGATWPDSIPFAAYVAGITNKVGFMIAHRPGFVAPTMAARMLAAIDRLSQGRTAVHIITGANDAEMEADGDFLTKDVRYERSAEYAQILRRMWSSPEPFDHDGRFYRFKKAFAQVKPVKGTIPIYWGGKSDEAIETAGACADVFALAIAGLEQTAAVIEKAKASAAAHGRALRFCLSTRAIVGPTEDAAWDYANTILEGVREQSDRLIRTSIANLNRKEAAPLNDETEKLLSRGAVIDERLWTEITRVTKGTRVVTSLVGTADQVSDALMKYYDLGVRSFLIHGFDLLTDPDNYGRELIPMLRAKAAAREAGL